MGCSIFLGPKDTALYSGQVKENSELSLGVCVQGYLGYIPDLLTMPFEEIILLKTKHKKIQTKQKVFL